MLASRIVLRKAFDVVAWTRSSEAFVSLCLLTVAGTSFLTDTLGFSDTLGAFLAGVLLAESNYRAQVEADIKPYKGILLGLFFLVRDGHGVARARSGVDRIGHCGLVRVHVWCIT